MKVCIVGASGKLGRCMVRHVLDRGYEVVAVCRPQSAGKLAILASNITRRVDFALFMVDALTIDALIREAPAIVGRRTPSALAHVAAMR